MFNYTVIIPYEKTKNKKLLYIKDKTVMLSLKYCYSSCRNKCYTFLLCKTMLFLYEYL